MPRNIFYKSKTIYLETRKRLDLISYFLLFSNLVPNEYEGAFGAVGHFVRVK